MAKGEESKNQLDVPHSIVNARLPNDVTPMWKSIEFMQKFVKIADAYCISNLLIVKECAAGVQTLEDVENACIIRWVELPDNKRSKNAVSE